MTRDPAGLRWNGVVDGGWWCFGGCPVMDRPQSRFRFDWMSGFRMASPVRRPRSNERNPGSTIRASPCHA